MTAKKKTDDEAPSTLDQMIEDVEQAEVPDEYPPGTPEFKNLLAVRPRSRRAEFKRLLGQLSEKSAVSRLAFADLQKIEDKTQREVAFFNVSAGLEETLEIVENALRLVAADAEKFDAWVAEVSDEDLQTTWAVYQKRAQPGEASSSAS